MMDTSKDIIPNMADNKGGQNDSSDVITLPNASLHSVSVHNRRDSVTDKSDLPSTHNHHPVTTTTTTTIFNDDTANWRELSQPRAKRVIARYGLGGNLASLNKLSGNTANLVENSASIHDILGSHDGGSHSRTGSELHIHFGSLDKTAVAASIGERIRSVEVELNRLREERKEMLRELEDKTKEGDVDERWEEGIMAIDEMI